MSSTTTDVTEAIKKVNSYFNDDMPKLWEDEEGLPKATISVYKKVASNVKKTLCNDLLCLVRPMMVSGKSFEVLISRTSLRK